MVFETCLQNSSTNMSFLKCLRIQKGKSSKFSKHIISTLHKLGNIWWGLLLCTSRLVSWYRDGDSAHPGCPYGRICPLEVWRWERLWRNLGHRAGELVPGLVQWRKAAPAWDGEKTRSVACERGDGKVGRVGVLQHRRLNHSGKISLVAPYLPLWHTF